MNAQPAWKQETRRLARHAALLAAALLLADANVASAAPPRTLWARGDYLLWSVRGGDTPPLVTTSPAGVPRSAAGVLGEPGTSVLFGGERIGDDPRSGGRVTFGGWLDEEGTAGVSATFFTFRNEFNGLTVESDGSPILAVPFFDVEADAPASNPVAFPGQLRGTLHVDASSELFGAGLLISEELCPCRPIRLELVSGYRFLSVDESLHIGERSVVANDPGGMIPDDTVFEISDVFDVGNEFHGADLGLRAEARRGRWSFEVLSRIAFGSNFQTVRIDGRQRVTVPGVAGVETVGGTLTRTSNIGRRTQHKFAVLPEVSVDLGFHLTDALRFSAGYTFLYFSRAVRPGEQIDIAIDGSGASNQPAFAFRESSLWVHGLQLGAEWSY